MNLHDWIDELCDVLDVDTEIDEGLILDLAREAAHKVERQAAPVSAYLLGYAAALRGGSPQDVEELAGLAMSLAEKWTSEEEPEEELEEELEPVED